MQGMAVVAPSKAELQEIADRIASRFNYGQPISDTMLARVGHEASGETGLPCKARIEDGNKLVIYAEAEPEPGLEPFAGW